MILLMLKLLLGRYFNVDDALDAYIETFQFTEEIT